MLRGPSAGGAPVARPHAALRAAPLVGAGPERLHSDADSQPDPNMEEEATDGPSQQPPGDCRAPNSLQAEQIT